MTAITEPIHEAIASLLTNFEPWTQQHATQWRSGFGLVWVREGRWYFSAVKPNPAPFETRDGAMRACEETAASHALTALRPLIDAALDVCDCNSDIGYVTDDRKEKLLDAAFGGLYGPWAALQILMAYRHGQGRTRARQ